MGVHEGNFGGGKKGVADHGKNTIPGPSIALVPPHFTRTPTLCVPLVTDPCNPLLILPKPLSLSLSLGCRCMSASDPQPPPPKNPPPHPFLLFSPLRPADLHTLRPLPLPLMPRDGEAWWGRGCAQTPVSSPSEEWTKGIKNNREDPFSLCLHKGEAGWGKQWKKKREKKMCVCECLWLLCTYTCPGCVY